MACSSRIRALDAAGAAFLDRLPPELQNILAESGFTDVGQLAAIDDLSRDEIGVLFRDAAADQTIADADVDRLYDFVQTCKVPASKRQRALAALSHWDIEDIMATAPSTTTPTTSTTPAPPAPPSSVWPTRFRRQVMAGDQPLASLEETERRRWISQLIKTIRKYNMPVLRLAEQSLDPDAALRRTMGGYALGLG